MAVPYPKALTVFPMFRQSLGTTFDACALSASFELAYNQGWSTHPQARGTIFHSTAARALTEMSRLGETSISPEVALAILHEVLRQADVDDICHELGCGLKPKLIPKLRRTREGNVLVCPDGHKHPSYVVNIPLSEIKDLYWETCKWAVDNEWDIPNLIDVERRLKASLTYSDGAGGSVERTLTGQLDALFLDAEDPEHMIVIDFKSSWALPPQTEVSFQGYAQQVWYAWLVMRNYRSINRVTLREFYVRFSEPREVSIDRGRMDDIEQQLSALVERFDRSYERDAWTPTPGKHCFSGDTRFITDEGIRSLREACGESVRVLNRHGQWEDAEVRSFGVQPLVDVTFGVGGRAKASATYKVRATPDHRWWQEDGTRVTTAELERAPLGLLREDLHLDPEGVRHGIVYGDGYVYGRRNYSMVKLQPHKSELSEWFDQELVPVEHYPGQVVTHEPVKRRSDGTVDVLLQPRGFKELPGTCSSGYARGFIAGLMATDGHVSLNGQTSISCEGLSAAERIAEIARMGGVSVTCVRVTATETPARMPQGPVAVRARELCGVYMRPSTVPLIREAQAARRRDKSQMRRMYADVLSVEHADAEEVFCVVAPGSESFTLANGILTSNCSYCTRPAACPIPVFAREEGRIVDKEHAAKVAAQLLVAEVVVSKSRAALKAFVEANGPVEVKNSKGTTYWGLEEVTRTSRPTEEQVARARRTGTPVESLFRTSKGTRFGQITLKPGQAKPLTPEWNAEEDQELMRQMEESVQAAVERVS